MSQKVKERIVGVSALLCAIGVCIIGVARGQRTNDFREAPQIVRCTPSAASVDTVLDVEGYRLGALLSPEKVRVHFARGGSDYISTPSGGEGPNVNDEGGIEHLDVSVPTGLVLGLCQIIVEVDGRRSAPVNIEITGWKPPEITEISPPWVQPGEFVLFQGNGFHLTDDIVLIDATGRRHQFRSEPEAKCSGRRLPTGLPEGEATIYIVNRTNPSDPPSRSFKLRVSNGPIPLDIWPSDLIPVAPGQWLDLVVTSLKPLEGAERAEVAFQQHGQFVISPIVNPSRPRVQVPRNLEPGEVNLLTRTWRYSKASSWSDPVSYQLMKQPVAPIVETIKLGSSDKPTYVYLYDGPDRPKMFEIKRGEAMTLEGMFLVESVEWLRVILDHPGGIQTLKPIALADPRMMKIVLPGDLQSGDWQISVVVRQNLVCD